MRKKKLYNDVIRIICSFLPVYKLRDWISEKKLSIKYLCVNPCEEAKNILERNWDKIDWTELSVNKSEYAIQLIKENIEIVYDKIEWVCLFQNPSEIAINIAKINMNNIFSDFIVQNTSIKAIPLIEEVLEKFKENEHIHYILYLLTSNNSDHAIKIIEKNILNLDRDSWFSLCSNTNPNAVHLIEEEMKKNPNNISWDNLCRNPSALYLIEEELKRNPNSKKINWSILCDNPSSEAVQIIEEELKRNPNNNEISWHLLSSNPSAIHLLKNNLDKIDWYFLCENTNPNIVNLIEKELKRDSMSDNICWTHLSGNPHALYLIESLLEKIFNKIDWEYLSTNPGIFEIVYNQELHDILMQL